MKTSIAGMTAVNGIQAGTGPSGINQPRLSGLLGEIPSGTNNLSVNTDGDTK